MDWTGLVCVVTGASSGFGREASVALARRGARVIAVARREQNLKSLMEEMAEGGHSFVVCDVSEIEQVRKMASAVASMTDHVDVLINNAGVRTNGPLAGAASEDIGRLVRTNLLGPIWCTRELLTLLEAAPRRHRTPVIVNVASMAGRVALPNSSDYSASKYGLVGFTESLWPEMNAKKIKVMMLNPGLAHTEGFPMDAIRANPMTSWLVMDADRVVAAMIRGIERGAFEVRVQWWMHPAYYLMVLMGPLRRRLTSAIRSVMGSDMQV